jgi:hypothetical protein
MITFKDVLLKEFRTNEIRGIEEDLPSIINTYAPWYDLKLAQPIYRGIKYYHENFGIISPDNHTRTSFEAKNY